MSARFLGKGRDVSFHTPLVDFHVCQNFTYIYSDNKVIKHDRTTQSQ